MSELIGSSISHYRILEKLGSGGMGVVYRARDERLDRDVALKILSPGTLADETARSRFRREALTLSQLNHPNIAVVHDFDSDEGVDFLAMEFVAGETLAAKLATGPLPEGEVVRLGTQIAEALEEAHERDIIHRDLKPGNVMVTPKGRVKVLDFGLAKLVRPPEVDGATASLAETQAGTVMGTMPYMAPEQLQGKTVDARADIYALGAVLYEMVTGQRPFPEKQSTQLIAAILTQPPQPPRHLNGKVSSGLESIILKALEKDPERRYPSAKNLLADLRELSLTGSIAVARWPGQRRRWALGALAAVGSLLVVVVAGLMTWIVHSRPKHPPGPAITGRIQSLAVLPMENLSGDPQQDYFADGMTQELTNDLARISALRVISRTSVMRYKTTRKPLPEIARELNVDAVVEGSVERAGGRVRIRAELISAPTDQHLWAESYERDVKDVFALESEVARDIAQQIETKLTPQEQTRLAAGRSVVPQAYDAYLKGLYFRQKSTEEGHKRAIEFFQQAIKEDPKYAPARAELASAYFDAESEKEVAIARAAAIKAIQIDETLAEAHAALAGIMLFHDWNWAGGEKESKRAVEVNPSSAFAHRVHARCLDIMGRTDEAVDEMKHARDLDPFSLSLNWALGYSYFLARRYDQAMEKFRLTYEMDPNYHIAHTYLAWTYEQQGKFPQAIEELQQARELSEGNPEDLAALARAYVLSGRRDEAEKVIDRLGNPSGRSAVTPYIWAVVYSALGDKGQAFNQLDKAYIEHSQDLPLLKVDPLLDPLRTDPRFQELERRVGLSP